MRIINAEAKDFIDTHLAELSPEARTAIPERVWAQAPTWAAVQTLSRSKLFDLEEYVRLHPEVSESGMEPLEYYVLNGIAEGHSLSRLSQDKPKIQVLRHLRPSSLYMRPLIVGFNITYMCNYDCSYCIGHEKLNKSKFSSKEDLLTAVDNIAMLDRDCYVIGFSGGEPTVHPHLASMITYASEKLGNKLDSVGMFSNGSRNTEFYNVVHDLSKKVNFNMAISLHTEFLDTDHIMDIIETHTNSISLWFNFMYNPEKRDFARQLFDLLVKKRKDYPFGLAIALLREPRRGEKLIDGYTDEDFSWRNQAMKRFQDASNSSCKKFTIKSRIEGFGDSAWDYIRAGERKYEMVRGFDKSGRYADGFFRFKNLYCCMGTTAITIHPAGGVSGAACPLAAPKYNMFKENPFIYEDFTRPIQCTLENCSCGANEPIAKFSSEEEAIAYSQRFKLIKK